MSLTEIKDAVNKLSASELAELAAFIRQQDNAAWDREIDADFAEDGRLRAVADEVRADIGKGRLEDRLELTDEIKTKLDRSRAEIAAGQYTTRQPK
jgi:hypothetical protein